VNVDFYSHQLTEDETASVWKHTATFVDIEEYEASAQWRMVRAIWRGRHRNASVCFICGRTEEIDLHHLAYGRVGLAKDWSLLDQLVPLCTDHHYEIEKRVTRLGWARAEAHLRYRDEMNSRQGHHLRL
jgi:hypothetical protein